MSLFYTPLWHSSPCPPPTVLLLPPDRPACWGRSDPLPFEISGFTMFVSTKQRRERLLTYVVVIPRHTSAVARRLLDCTPYHQFITKCLYSCVDYHLLPFWTLLRVCLLSFCKGSMCLKRRARRGKEREEIFVHLQGAESGVEKPGQTGARVGSWALQLAPLLSASQHQPPVFGLLFFFFF